MRRRRRVAVAGAALVAAATALPAGGGATTAPGVPWTQALPAAPSPPQQGRQEQVRFCRRASMRCVDFQVRRMLRLRGRLGCDHRAVFATTYLELTRELRRTLRRDPGFLVFPRYFFREDALFANYYFNVVRGWHVGRRIPPAWGIAFEVARSADVTAAQDMLLGINAHVQNDMPLVLARLGLRSVRGLSRKPDHDRVNEVLTAAYDRVVEQVRRRYDPSIALTNSTRTPFDDVAGLEVVRGWRELVWRNAERLVNARSRDEWRRIRGEIEEHAAAWARAIAATPWPGHRERRDRYCRSRLGR